jgi:glycosyltransferase involved in cell wall biosynthesis
MDDLTVIIPAYNEEGALQTFLPEILSFCQHHGCELIVVNDGSRDGTGELLNRYAGREKFHAIHHKLNKGYGGAIKEGIRATTTRYCVTIDADGQHQPKDIINLYRVITEADGDMVVGQRKKHKGNLYRRIGKRIIYGIAQLLMHIEIKDLNSGMKIYRTELAKNYISLCPNNMPFSDIITLIFINQRHLVLETPITILPRTKGTSTISTKTAVETVMEILHIMTLFNPMKVFLPVALFFLGFSAIWGLPIVFRGEGVSVGTLFLFVTGLLFFFLGLIAEQLALIRKELLNVRADTCGD